jgi:tetratricopeptide (TPR) repeat protein
MHAQTRGKFKEAMRWFKRYLRYSKNQDERWFIYFQMVSCQLARNKKFRAFMLLRKMEAESPKRWETKKLTGIVWLAAGRYEKAIEWLVNTFDQNKYETLYKPIPRDDAGTWNMVGECYFKLGNYQKAEISFNTAVQFAQSHLTKTFYQKRTDMMSKLANYK